MTQRTFQPSFRTRLLRKEMNSILNTRELRMTLPLFSHVAELMNVLFAPGADDPDHSALVQAYESQAANDVRPA